ncbi:30S ribosomal protein S9 [Candidatus Kaiserbacteria bacterium RIFCSPHIGHO2_01_FULL_56_24]|uniref:Small ribosomal subunit protein uS9 n=1 Tax=Candidatus Kaiserbacteria bacterium RIFCSPHIGHO2_01_FULL_56_24 TaxID=1798487 RepID=A0A1F6DF60_9BACT|nr:MAG: 30S ribosomal protein S9 [Candidatus Kaiserbacteria bacterium RIFCSPHIGHO2_01_FULL_56_24]
MAEKKYIETVGRRKTASARVRITAAKTTSFTINDRTAEDYFPLAVMHQALNAPFKTVGGAFAVTVLVKGGGLKAQAEAIRHGISRALVEMDAALRKDLKVKGFLKRDPRAKERKKFGLVAARRAPQWSKR